MNHIVLSRYQAQPLLKQRSAVGETVGLSPDLGLSRIEVTITSDGVVLSDGCLVSWDDLEMISDSENNCFLIDGEGIATKIAIFSETSNRLCSLMPTREAPTLLLSGIPMHRIKDTTPQRDTVEKVRAASPIVGAVLDTATGLGYTAIRAAQHAEQVITIEFDPAVLEVARLNPWSRELFTTPHITQRHGDAADVVPEYDDSAFNRIIHDPPAMSLAGHLYGADFYGELFRVLRSGGRMFHYIGDPNSRSGRNITRGVIERLQRVGFVGLRRRPRAFGVVVRKP